MEKMKRELVINVTVLSFILSALYGVLVTNINNTIVSNSDNISDQGGFVVFGLFFLFMYLFHVIISFLNFVVTRIVGMELPKRLFVFNALGLVLVGSICLIVKDATVLFLIFSLVIYSLFAIFNSRNLA
ncbi:hypothetical protein SAMN05428961_1204 [Paenibacillus sp. OK060]|uniref:hypothetical protein n=1 Tax=Paenibacillus sp. OK060 TaxID=1881034 RepID=UPI00088C220F|nr:hypothetical protein [Paenibacillus sp. OK060]SDM47424.1 hypothetical protein SAMN05428961_1204 [Paenibacillus sp. OK060]